MGNLTLSQIVTFTYFVRIGIILNYWFGLNSRDAFGYFSSENSPVDGQKSRLKLTWIEMLRTQKQEL